MSTRVRYKEVNGYFVSNRFQGGNNIVQVHIDFNVDVKPSEQWGVRLCTNEESFSTKVDCSSWEGAKKLGKKLLKEAGVIFEVDMRRRKANETIPF